MSLLLLAACENASSIDPMVKAVDLTTPKAEPHTAKVSDGACGIGKVEGPLVWIEDDYAAALACAKAKSLPVVIDFWAPWCHTCLSMQHTIFTDPSFAAKSKLFVYLALDTDRDQNAAAVAKYPLSAWPTFYVIAPDESVLARFVGGASLAQFHAFLDAGARAMAGTVAGPDMHLLTAERAIAAKDYATADRELTAALAAAPKTWPRRPDALVSAIGTKHKLGDIAGCMTLAEEHLDSTGNTASATDFLYHAAECSEELAPKDAPPDPARDERIVKLRTRAVARLAALADDPSAPLSADDKSDLYLHWRDLLESLERGPEAKQVAERQRQMLDAAAAKMPNPEAASTYNWPRAEVYAYLGRPLELVPALEQSVKDLPKDYDPPARLGWIYMKGGKLPEAAKWTEAAIALAYGPRKVRVLTQRADIAKAQADFSTEQRYRKEVVATLEALPPSQTTPEAIAKAKAALAALQPPVAAP